MLSILQGAELQDTQHDVMERGHEQGLQPSSYTTDCNLGQVHHPGSAQ